MWATKKTLKQRFWSLLYILLVNFEHEYTDRKSMSMPCTNVNPLSDNPTKWSNTLKQFVIRRLLLMNYLSVLAHFVGLASKGLFSWMMCWMNLTHFISVLHFYTSWKHQKAVRFSDVFRGYGNLRLGTSELKLRKKTRQRCQLILMYVVY